MCVCERERKRGNLNYLFIWKHITSAYKSREEKGNKREKKEN